MEDNDIKLAENAPVKAIVVNDETVTIGAFSVSVKKSINDAGNVEILFDGVLSMPLFEPELHKIESRRYIIDEIDVYEEDYGSEDENIIYRFTCGYFRTKYQTDLKDTIESFYEYGKEKQEQTDGK